MYGIFQKVKDFLLSNLYSSLYKYLFIGGDEMDSDVYPRSTQQKIDMIKPKNLFCHISFLPLEKQQGGKEYEQKRKSYYKSSDNSKGSY